MRKAVVNTNRTADADDRTYPSTQLGATAVGGWEAVEPLSQVGHYVTPTQRQTAPVRVPSRLQKAIICEIQGQAQGTVLCRNL